MLFGLCRSVWIISCLSVVLVHIPELQHAPLPLKCYEPWSVPQLFILLLFSPWTHNWIYQGAWGCVMNIASHNEMLQAKYLNFDTNIVVERDPWQRDHILIMTCIFNLNSKGDIEFFRKKRFKVIEQRWLMFQQKCKPNKGHAWQQNVDESNLAEAN